MRQVFLKRWDSFVKNKKILLQNAIVITKCVGTFTNYQRQVIQSE